MFGNDLFKYFNYFICVLFDFTNLINLNACYNYYNGFSVNGLQLTLALTQTSYISLN